MTGGAGTERRRVVVIGVGNEFRRDDGIGPEVVSRLRGQAPADVRLVVSDGDPTRMIEAWTGASLVVVVDAVLPVVDAVLPVVDAVLPVVDAVQPDAPPASPSPFPGRLHRIVVDRAAGAGAHPVSSHGLGLGQSVALAQALGRMPERLIVHAVEVSDVRQGVGLSPAVAAAADALTAAVLQDLPAGRGPEPDRARQA